MVRKQARIMRNAIKVPLSVIICSHKLHICHRGQTRVTTTPVRNMHTWSHKARTGSVRPLLCRWGHTPLQHAISRRHGPAIELLQRAGADLGFADAARPLCAAAVDGDMRLLTRLLDNGVDANARCHCLRHHVHILHMRFVPSACTYLSTICNLLMSTESAQPQKIHLSRSCPSAEKQWLSLSPPCQQPSALQCNTRSCIAWAKPSCALWSAGTTMGARRCTLPRRAAASRSSTTCSPVARTSTPLTCAPEPCRRPDRSLHHHVVCAALYHTHTNL